jgi:hypothetical protein
MDVFHPGQLCCDRETRQRLIDEVADLIAALLPPVISDNTFEFCDQPPEVEGNTFKGGTLRLDDCR